MHKGYQVLLALLFLGFCTVFFNYWPKDSAQWASWVQAVGSIAAIGVAIAVARHQANKQRQLFIDEADAVEKNRIDLRIEAVQGAATLISTALMGLRAGCVELRRAGKEGHRIQYSRGPMLRMRDAVVRMPLHESPYCLFAKEIAMCTYQIEKFIGLASKMAGTRPVDERHSQFLELEEIESSVVDLTAALLEKTSTYDGARPVLSPRDEA